MKNIFVDRPILAIVLSIIITVLGFISLWSLPVEQYPNITPPTVNVRASYQGADAMSVDQAVATPVAQGIMGVSDMLYIKSTSSNDGQMLLRVSFDIDSDPDMNAILTQNNVSTIMAMLPEVVKQQGVVTRKASTGFLLVFSLFSDGRYDSKYLSNYAYINIQNELLRINGVGELRIMGAGEYSMRIWVQPDKLAYLNISINDIVTAIEAQSGIFPAGQLGAEPSPDSTEFTYTVTMPSQLSAPEQYEDIVIKTLDDGSRILLRDVANVSLESRNYGINSSFEGKPAAVIAVYQAPGSNAMAVGTAVKDAMKSINERLPDGVMYQTVVDTTSSISAGIQDIAFTLILALLLVIVIIYIFLQDWRATIIPLVAVPVSIVGAFMLFPLFGFSINVISLLGMVLAIGLVVDDAIVVVEAVQVNIEKGMNSRQATIEAMKVVTSPIIATTIVLISVFLPVSFVGGITGKMYQQFSITIAVSVAISALNALTLSPALCSIILKNKKAPNKGFFKAFNNRFGKGVEGYLKGTNIAIRHSVRTLLLTAILGVVMILGIRALPSGFLPEEDQGYLMATVTLPDAASLKRTTAVADKIEKILLKRDDIQYTSSVSGINIIAEVSATYSAVVFIKLKDYSQRKQSASEIAIDLNKILYMAIPEAKVAIFGPPSIQGLGITSGISMSIQDRGGNDVGYLVENAEKFIAKASELPEIATMISQFNAGVPQRSIEINRDYALREGVSIDDIHKLLTTYLGGQYINNFNRFGKLYQTYIQADASYRQNKDNLNSYFVKNRNGQDVPISAFVTVKDTVGVEYISQFNLYRSISLNVIPNKGYSTSQGMEALQELADNQLPSDMSIAWSDISFQEQRASSSGVAVYLFAFLFVFLCLAALYNSWTLPLSVLLGIPFAILGSVILVWLVHIFNPAYINNLFMQISIIMLIGLSAKNAILIVEYANKLFFDEGKSLSEAAMEAAKVRIRPILMTVFAFILGIMPLVFASGAYSGARNIMGVALLGGITIATLLGIFVYPALYVLTGKISRFENKRERMKKS